jgi:hypothetical protein
VNRSLQNLHLGSNDIGKEGAAALADALKVSACAYPVLSFLLHFTCATALPRQGVLDDFSFGSSNIPPRWQGVFDVVLENQHLLFV